MFNTEAPRESWWGRRPGKEVFCAEGGLGMWGGNKTWREPRVPQTAEESHDLFYNAATRLPLKHSLAN